MRKIWVESNTQLSKSRLKKIYTSVLPTIRAVARKSGYAIGVHGSLTRDLDLIAAPWAKGAVQPVTLAARIHSAISKYSYSPSSLRKQGSGNKPYGRQAYVLHLGFHGRNHQRKSIYVDLSITPKV